MLIKYDDLNRVLERIEILAKDDNKQTNLMFTLKDDDKLEISFCAGRSNLFQTIPVSDVITEDIFDEYDTSKLVHAADLREPLIMNYNKIKEVMTLFKATDTVKVSDITFCQTVKNGAVVPNSVSMSCEKTVNIIKKLPDNTETTEIQHVASLDESIRWDDPNSSMKLKIYTRYPSSDAIIPDDVEYDTWGASELRDILGKITADKGRQTLISSARKVGFVYNPTNSILVNIHKDSDSFHNTVIFDSTSCSQVYNMLGKISGDIKLYVDEENHNCKINSEDNDVLLSITIPDANPTYIKSLNTYQNLKINDVQCTILRAVFKDIVKAINGIANSGKSEAAAEAVIRCVPVVGPDNTSKILTKKVVRNGNEVEAQVYHSQLIFDNVKSASGNSSNKMALELPTVRVAEGELGVDVRDTTLEYKVKFSFATLLKVLDNLKSDVLAIDIKYENADKSNMTIRLAEVDLEAKRAANAKAVETVRTEHGLSDEEPVDLAEYLSNDEVLNSREDSLGIMGFVQVKL